MLNLDTIESLIIFSNRSELKKLQLGGEIVIQRRDIKRTMRRFNKQKQFTKD